MSTKRRSRMTNIILKPMSHLRKKMHQHNIKMIKKMRLSKKKQKLIKKKRKAIIK